MKRLGALALAMVTACGGGGGGGKLTDDECARWAKLWVYGPNAPTPLPALQDTVTSIEQICRKGQVTRAEYECGIAAKDEPSFTACAGAGRLSDDECHQFADRYLLHVLPAETPHPVRDGLAVHVLNLCLAGQVDREELACLFASSDEAGDRECETHAQARHPGRDLTGLPHAS